MIAEAEIENAIAAAFTAQLSALSATPPRIVKSWEALADGEGSVVFLLTAGFQIAFQLMFDPLQRVINGFHMALIICPSSHFLSASFLAR